MLISQRPEAYFLPQAPPVQMPVKHQQLAPQQAPVVPYLNSLDSTSREDHLRAEWAAGNTELPKTYQPPCKFGFLLN